MESFPYNTFKGDFTNGKTPVKRKKIRRPGICTVCGKSFNDSSAVYTHRRIHTGEKPFVCNVCGRGFNQNSNLKRHLRSHRGEKPFYCVICDKKYTFKSRPYFQQHLLSHKGEKPFACELCDKSYSFKASLLNHMRVHAKKHSFICDICHAGFSCEGRLNSHMRIHDADKQVFMCALCKRVFTTIFSRNAHLANSHNILTAYECKVCHKRYRNQQGLRMHQKRHETKGNTLSAAENKKRPSVLKQENSNMSNVCLNEDENISKNAETNTKGLPSILTSTSFINNFMSSEQLQLLPSHDTVVNNRFLCGVCQNEFTSMIEINQHVKTHVKSEEVSVSQTEDIFSDTEREPRDNVGLLTSDSDIKQVITPEQLELFFSHGSVNHRFLCGVCQKEFSYVTEINEHVENHRKRENFSVIQEEISSFTESESKDVCILTSDTDCKKEVITPEQLQHLLSRGLVIHRFLCGVCEEVFNSITELNGHLSAHTNGKNLFVCGLCSGSFSSGDELKSHINNTHII